MISPKFPENETQRMAAVKSYNIIDTLPEQDYDDITELVASVCDTPIALITALDEDRNFFKSHHGIPFNDSPREISFCGHAILGDDILIIKDARKDERFKDNPLVVEQQAIFYAGVPLIDPEGYKIGTLCTFDHKPREFSPSQIKALKTLGKQVVKLFESRRNNYRLQDANDELKVRYKQLKKFASHVSHDLKSPLVNIIALTNLLKDENNDTLTQDTVLYIHSIEESANILKNYIDGILKHYKTDELIKSKRETIELSDLCQDISQILIVKNDELICSNRIVENINKSALSQILINLVDNGLKYNDKSQRIVKISYDSLKNHHQFTVDDNGIGIPVDQQETIFDIFQTIQGDFSKSSTGIGLSSVKNLVEKLNGHITINSEVGKGSTFTFTIEK
ncbi:sensor histidine kinase [Winogradskyella bathintestinalis]|uniref:histidine kinase n=1 Tax=Winogradskyella bathintestinalis TaxID=3035208 RepID=A0ABT7ZVX0_9FLAO|nr:GAF domain-containing sensor histidine kinase [Winogradskyella bathintestinalis]MDN3493135.1 GAF domain-containing sensor histidine kinase [Winogradskyella bathintestinalis]